MRKLFSAIFLTAFATCINAEIVHHFPKSIEETRYKWRSAHSELSETSFSCPAYIRPEITFESGSIYKDTPCRCEIDPKKKAQYDAEVAAVREFMAILREVADRYVATPVERPEIAQCVASHIQYWAGSGAMTGNHMSSVGYHKTAEVLGAASLAYLKVKGTDTITYSLSTRTLHNWLHELSNKVINFYSTDAGPTTQNNNHRYWDSYFVGAASIVLQDKKLFGWAMQGLDIAINQIQDNGTLPLELKRGDKAYHYHLYALRPILGLSEMAAKNRAYMPNPYYPYTKNNNAIPRLAMMVMEEANNLDSSMIFSSKRDMRCHEATWLEIYLRRNSSIERTPTSPMMASNLEKKREECNGFLKNTQVGGNMTLYFGLTKLGNIINQ